MNRFQIRSVAGSFILTLLFTVAACGEPVNNPGGNVDFEKQLEYFNHTKQEDLKPTIWDTGDTTITNEDRLDLFEPHVKDLKGGYIGVGSTQNFSLAAWAKSDWIWLMDFTRVVVRANRVNIAFLQEAPTPADFRNLWEGKSQEAAYAAIEKHYANDPELEDYKKAWRISRVFQQKRFRTDDKLHEKRGINLWLYDQKLYDHIRGLAQQGRIQAVKGDLRGPVTVQSIAQQAKKMDVTIRIAYYSNAEEYFPLGDSFRKNWLSIPVDDKSVIVRTISVYRNQFPWAEDSHFSTDRGFHYSIQPAENYQLWLKHAKPNIRIHEIMKTGKTDPSGFTLITAKPPGMPEENQAEAAEE